MIICLLTRFASTSVVPTQKRMRTAHTIMMEMFKQMLIQ